MFELDIARQIVSLALDYAKQNNAAHITQFTIEMSRAVDASEDELRLHLETLVRGTLAEGAQFDIQRVPVHLHCLKCDSVFEQAYFGQACPQCHSARVVPQVHDEFKLTSIEID